MKNPILRILISAILLSLIFGIAVSVIGLLLGWKTSTQFGDGFFWAGILLLSIGFVNILGMFYQPADSRMLHSQTAVHLNIDERHKIWEADILHGYRILAFLGISSLLLFGLAGLAILIGKLF